MFVWFLTREWWLFIQSEIHGDKYRTNNVMSCYIGLHYSLYYRDDSHALWHVRRFKWWGFYGLFLNYVNQTTKSNLSPINYQKICVNKNVLRKPLIRSSGFPKSKTNFLPTVVTISFISNKTRHSYSKWAKKRLSWISKVLALFKKLQFTINSNKKKLFQ